jgi:hypothetical protein
MLAKRQTGRAIGLILCNSFLELLGNVFKWAREYGDVYKFYVVNEVRVVISKAELMESILSSNIHITKSNSYDHLESWLGNGLLMSKGKYIFLGNKNSKTHDIPILHQVKSGKYEEE